MLLCDEPTGALDAETGRLVLRAIEHVNRTLGTTTAVITHNVVIADMADRVVRMTSGRITDEPALGIDHGHAADVVALHDLDDVAHRRVSVHGVHVVRRHVIAHEAAGAAVRGGRRNPHGASSLRRWVAIPAARIIAV